MVGIVSGNSLGLDLTSGATLGQRGQLGQSALGQTAERSYVNVATGNLVVQDVDDFLASNGLDVTALRTYNSQGLLDDDNADNWSNGFYKKQLQFTGAAGSTGTVTRTAQDGSQAVYIYDAGRSAATGKPTYVTTAGVGAYDTISYSNAASQYTWTDGDSGISETYTINGANEARLTSATDHRGGATSYEYKANGLISKVTGGSGEAILYDYDDTTKRLMSVKYVATSGAQTAQVSFTYDGSARLATSAVDLTPENLADNATPSTIYTTTYTYDGASKRLASITQGDKTTIKFTYTLSNGVHRVTRVEDGLGKITNYTYTANQTAVKDALGNTTTYNYDASGQLLKITSPAVDGAPLITEFTYDGAGNLTDVVDATGARTKMEYVNGNQTFQRDAAGNTVQRTFDERNNLLTETRFAQAAAENFGAGLASQPKTTRYLYDGTDKNLLLYAISAEGRVTGYEYNALNQLEFTREYHAASFQVSTLAPDAILLDAWASGRDHRVTQYKYDFRGQLDQHIVFAPVGNSTTATASTTFYVRDAGGNLRETTSSTGSRTQYLYDGLNRVHTFTNGMGEQTLTSWNDAGSSVSVTQANGLVTTTLRDKAGRVTSVVEGFIPAAGSPMTVLGTTRYAWDAAGQLVMVEDPTQERSFMLYDAAGRKVADIDATGTLTEYSYNKNNLLTRSYTYSGTALPESLFVTAGVPRSPMPTLASLQSLVATPIANTATDIQSWRIYDSANRLVREIDGRGAVTDTVYNALSQVVSVTQRANRLADVSALGKTPTLAQTQVAANAGEDRAARNFHDADGLLLAELDAEGYLSEHTYNYNGELVRTIRYATQVEASLRTAQELADLRPSTDSQKDAVTWFIRDAGGRVAGEVDAEGYLTEKQYDSEGRLTASVRYDNKVAGTMTFARSLGDARPTATNEARTTTWTYDNLNRISRETDAQGTVTQYTYDNAGHLVKTERALGTAELRTSQVRYDIQGRLIGELTAEGALALAAPGAIAAQVWSQWGITHAYDAAGRRTGTTDQYGNKTRFYYDGDSRLTHTIDALGGITENQYNVLGQLKATVRYATAIAPATLATLIGGLVTSALTTAIAAAASDSSDSKTSYAWNLGGALDSVTDATGVKTSYLYNAFGQETSRTRSLGAVAIYTQLTGYDSRGQVTSTKADDGGLNAWTTASYDAFGRVVKTTDANWIEREYRYDKLGRQIALENGLGRWSSTSYDAFDRILSTTDELNQTTTYSYDLLARSVRVTTPEGFAVTTTFNRFGQTLTVSDARNAADKTTYDYDDNGNLTRTTFADGTSTSTDYDRAARIVKTTDAGLNEVQLAYDGASRLLTRTVNPGGLNLVTTYGWDAKGQQVRITDANQVVTQLDYDLNGRLVKQTVDPTVAGGAVELNLVTSFSYDASGNLQSIVRPNANATGDGAITLYFYDKLGRRTREETRTGTTVADPFTTGTIVTARDWQYDKVGNLLRAFDGNGNSTRYVYDADNQLRYTIDALGNVQGTNYTDTGLVYQRRTYAQAISLTSLPAAPTLQDIEALLAPSQLDRFEGNLYDKDGRVTATLNSLGHVVHYQHDASGNLIERRAYVNAVTSWDGVSVPQPAPDARDERIRTVYDKLNRAIYTIDGNGAVVAQAYNANGQVQERRAYAVAIAPETAATQTALAQAVALIADDTRDVRTSMRYDRAGRLEWTADGMGAVTQRSYDKNGNLSALRQYATPLAAGLAPSQATANWMTDRVTNFTWDAANRQVFTVQATRDLAGDLGGAVTRNHYDGNGNLTRRTSYAKLLTTLPTTTGTIETALGATQADDRVEQFAYDAANRRVYSIDGANAVTKLDYDSAGNVVKTTRYATTMTTAQRAGLSTNASANDILVRTSATPSLDRIERSAYDAANRLRYAVDGAGTVRETSFDALGRLTSTVLHARQVTFAHSATVSLTDIKSALGSPLAADRTESYNYDSQGRLLSSTDALGYTESYSYDAIGRKQSFTNKAGAVWTYQHDASGRVTTETSPTVLRTPTSLDAAGNLVLGTPVNVQPQTHLSYDALGNLLQRKEAAGLDEERITRYEYDSLGRQVATIHGDIQTRTWYDTLGNAVAGMDQAGNYSYKSYDRAGQLAFEIDAGGYMTAYERNAFGEVKTLTRYNGATTAITPTPAGLTYAQAKARAIALDVSQSRSIETVYDTAGRVKTVTEPAGFIYDADTGTTSVDGRASTSYAYNAFGQVTRSSDGKGTTDHFYDAGGLEVATLDAMGFLTKREFFETGELKKLTEFATAVTVPASYSATRPADPATTREDRVTEFTYDLAGRKLSETRRKVEVTSGSTSAGHASGTFTVSTTTPVKQTLLVTTPANSGTRIADVMFFAGADGSSVIQWPTPPAGTIARVSWRVQGTDTWTSASDLIVTDGASQSISIGADTTPNILELELTWTQGNAVVGRETSTLTISPRTGAAPTSSITGIANTIVALLNGVRVLKWPTPAEGVVATIQIKPPGSTQWETWPVKTEGSIQYVVLSSSLQAGTYQVELDLQRLNSATPVQDLQTLYQYDKLGNLTQTTDALGNNSYSYYDAQGRVTATVTPAIGLASEGGTITPLAEYYHDALGNVVGKVAKANGVASANADGYVRVDAGLNPADRTDRYKVDRFGHITQITNAQGVSSFMSYDRMGRLERTWQGVTTATGAATIYQAFEYDKAGRVVRVRQPSPTTLTGAVGESVTVMGYNGFGEMTSRRVDALEAEYFEYSTAGRLWRTNADDGIDRIYLYDLQGRVTQEIRSAGRETGPVNIITVLNPATAATSTDVRRTITQYDKLGRVIKTMMPQRQDSQGGVTVSHMTTAASITQQASVVRDDYSSGYVSGNYHWTMPNRVQLSWASLASLGSGDIKVELKYTSAAFNIPEVTVETGANGELTTYPAINFYATATSITKTFTAEEAASGPVMEWLDQGSIGGISAVNGLTVWKKDINGQWVKLIDQNALGDGSNSITIAAPTALDTAIVMQVRDLGNTSETAWRDLVTTNFGDQLYFDTSGLASDVYEYRVRTKRVADTAWAVTSSGVIDLNPPLVAKITTAITPAATFATTPGAGYSWTSPGASVVQTWRYRAAGTTGVWLSLPVASRGTGIDGVDASALPPGLYDYELLYNQPGEMRPYARASGQMTVAPSQGIEPVSGMTATGRTDGTALLQWTKPTDTTVTSVLRIKPPGGTLTAVTIGLDASGLKQQYVLPANSAYGTHQFEITQTRGGVVIAITTGSITMSQGAVPAAVITETTPAYIALTAPYAEPAAGAAPRVSGFQFQTAANGGWNVSWTAPTSPQDTQVFARLRGDTAWTLVTAPTLTVAAGRQRLDLNANVLQAGDYDLKVLTRSGTTVTGFTSAVVTIAADTNVAATAAITTPPQATFAANADSSWSLQWTKPPVGSDVYLKYRRAGTADTWNNAAFADVAGTSFQKADVSPTGLTQGTWEFDLYFVDRASGQRTEAALRNVTVTPPVYKAATQVVTTDPLTTKPPIPGLTWSTTAGVGSTFTWSPLAAGTVLTVKSRLKGTTTWPASSIWQFVPPQTSQMIPAGTFVDGTYEIELTVTSGATVLSCSRRENTVTNGNIASVDTTVTAITPTFSSTASNGEWKLQWTPPATGTLQLRFRTAGSSDAWVDASTRVSGTTTKSVTFFAYEAAPGTYEMELFYTDASGKVTHRAKSNITVSSVVTAPTFAPTAAAATPPTLATISARPDGGFRLTWTAAAGTVSSTFKLIDAYGGVVINPGVIQVSGTSRWIDIADTLAPGIVSFEIADFNGLNGTGTRLDQAFGKVTVANDSPAATLVQNYAAITPAPVAKANADGSWSLTWVTPPAGTTAKLNYRIAGGSWAAWPDAITTSGGNSSVNVAPTRLVAGTYEFDLYFERSSTRTNQTFKRIVVSAPGVAAPTVSIAPSTYVPKSYTLTQTTAALAAVTSAVQTFVVSAAPEGISNFSHTATADGGSVFQWTSFTGGRTATFKYRLIGTSTWITPPITPGSMQSVTFVPSMAAGQYEVELGVTLGSNTVGFVAGTLFVPSSGTPTASLPIAEITSRDNALTALTPTVNRKVDRWGNMVEANDPRAASWITKYRYNANNQLVEQAQTNGTANLSQAAFTTIVYDQLGRQVAVTDAMGRTNEQAWDAAGNLISEIHADGGVVRYRYNGFNDRTQTVDARGFATDYAYDKLSRLKQTTYAPTQVSSVNYLNMTVSGASTGRVVEQYDYDEAGRKVRQTSTYDGTSITSEAVSYEYDLRGNVTKVEQAGVTTRLQWDTQGRKTAEVDGNGSKAEWTYDYFGRVTYHKDIGGAVYSYAYDKAKQLIAITNDRPGGLKQNLAYTYDTAGLLVKIKDNTLGQTTTYAYDLAGARIREKTTQLTNVNGVNVAVTYQDNHLAYDTFGRLAWVGDGRAYVTMAYDKVGNRTNIKTHVITAPGEDTGEITHDTDRYFEYDAMNRQTKADVNAKGELGTTGHEIKYDKAGNKISDTWLGNQVTVTPGTTYTQTVYGPNGDFENTYSTPATYSASLGLTTEAYTYDARGKVVGIDRDGVRVDTRFYDAAGRTLQTGAATPLDTNYLKALNGTNSQGAVLDGNGTERRTNLYDANGRLVHQMVRNNEGGLKYDLYYTKPDNTANYDGAGNMLGYILNNDEAKTQYQYTNTYEKREGYVQTVVDGVHDKKPELSGKSTSTYDANGYLVGVTDSTLGANNRTFVNDANGRVLYAKQGSHIQRQLIVNGEVLGRYGEMVDDKAARNPDGSPVFKTSADFNFGYAATAGNTPDLAQRVHVVGAGDTLEAIAKAMYGDTRLWYRIADANGMTSNADLKAGQLIKIPGTETSSNNADTFRPYRPGEIIGDTNPNMPRPPPKKASMFGQLLVIVVAIIVTIYTAGAAAAALGQATATTVATATTAATTTAASTFGAGLAALSGGTAVVGGATVTIGAGAVSAGVAAVGGAVIGGAMGSIASQAVGVGLGMQDSINWKGVGLSALSAGVTSGLGAAATGALSGPDLNAVMGRAALGNLVTQGVGVATGLQDKFNWRSTVASAAGAGAGQVIGDALSSARAFEGLAAYGAQLPQIARGTVSGLAAGTTAAVLRGGKISVQQVGVDAFGNALGSSIADTLSTAPAVQGVGPNSSSAYVNGMDLQSDQAYAARREREWSATNDIITARKATEAFESGVNGMTIPSGYVFAGGPMSPADQARGSALLHRDFDKQNAREAQSQQAPAEGKLQFLGQGEVDREPAMLKIRAGISAPYQAEPTVSAKIPKDSVGDWVKSLNLPAEIPGMGWLSAEQGLASAQNWRSRLDRTGNPLYAVAEGVATLWAEHGEEVFMVLGSIRGVPTKSGKLASLDAEISALQRIGQNPAGPNLTAREPNSVLLKQAETISTAKANQSTTPRDLQEQALFNRVLESPASGNPLRSLSGDARFAQSAGFTKMEATHRLPDGSSISIHYQYNSTSGRPYDIKIVTPQPAPAVLQPGRSIR